MILLVLSSAPEGEGMAEVIKLVLRLPEDVWAQMKEWAEAEDRSLNGQIIHVLKRALKEWRT